MIAISCVNNGHRKRTAEALYEIFAGGVGQFVHCENTFFGVSRLLQLRGDKAGSGDYGGLYEVAA
jgi:hypothetical protein